MKLKSFGFVYCHNFDTVISFRGNMDMEKYGKDIVPSKKETKKDDERFSPRGKAVELDLKMEGIS